MTTSNSSRRDPLNPNRDAPFLLTFKPRAPWVSELCDNQLQHRSATRCAGTTASNPQKSSPKSDTNKFNVSHKSVPANVFVQPNYIAKVLLGDGAE
jgi:hypothetical protein